MEKKEKSYELRSEKVRSIVGETPPVLIRYGTLFITIALLLFVGLSAFLPYRIVYNGEAIVADSRDTIRLHFEGRIPEGNAFYRQVTFEEGGGTLQTLFPERDAKGYQKGIFTDSTLPLNRRLHFTMVEERGHYLSYFIRTIFPSKE